jgi:hypothetical protein
MSEILYVSRSYSQFEIPAEIEQELFKQFPPTTALGSTLFTKCNPALYSTNMEALLKNDTLHFGYLITDKRPFCTGWTQLKTRIVYMHPVLTSNPKATDDEQNDAWSSIIEHDESGVLYSHSMDCSEPVRSCKELIALLKEKTLLDSCGLSIATIPEDCEYGILQEDDETESIEILHPIVRILKELKSAVDPTKLPASSCLYTRQIISGELSVSDLRF